MSDECVKCHKTPPYCRCRKPKQQPVLPPYQDKVEAIKTLPTPVQSVNKPDKPSKPAKKEKPLVIAGEVVPPKFGLAEFGEMILLKKFYPKQREVLEALTPYGSFVSFRSCNGGGKTREVITTAILAHMVLYDGKVITTSGSFRQIRDQLTPALKVYSQRFPLFDFQQDRIVTRNPNSFWDGFSTNDAGRFEGHHGDKNNPLLIIVDEAKTVKDPIYEAIERCRVPRQYCRILFASSAGYAQGEFFRSQTMRANALTHPPIVQRAIDCPHISKAEQEALRAKWGPDHPLIKSLLDAEFMPFVEGAVVNLAALDDLLADPPPHQPGQRKYFCDFAWSESGTGDQNVCAKRDGNKITVPLKFRAKGLHAVCARFVQFFNQEGCSPWEIEGDADGDGANIIKQLASMGWPIGSAHNGGQPRYNDHYANLASEMWCDMAQGIINRQWILPDDLEFYGQALNRRIVPNNRGKLSIESKLAMKDPNREGGSVPESPDVCDAVAGACAPLPLRQARQVMGNNVEHLPSNKDDFWREFNAVPVGQEPVDHVPGAWAG